MSILLKYDNLKSKVVNRKEAFDKFIQFLEKETSWLRSPASTRYHLNKEGGLLEHSVGVADTLVKFREFLAPTISEESCVIVGLFHDVGKVGMPGKARYLPNDNQWEIEKRNMVYKINPHEVCMSLSVRSLYLVSKYIPLSESEVQAITYHDGQYIMENKLVAHKEEALTLLLHWADYWTAHIHENAREIHNEIKFF